MTALVDTNLQHQLPPSIDSKGYIIPSAVQRTIKPNDPHSVAAAWLDEFAAAVYVGDVDGVVSTMLPEGWLRDLLVFTKDTRSLAGAAKIKAYLDNTLAPAQISNIKLDERLFYGPSVFNGPPVGVESAFTFDMPTAHGRGFVRLLPDGAGGHKAFTLFVMLSDWKGHEERGYESRPYEGYTVAWGDVLSKTVKSVESDPQVLILGGGQCGLSVAARFKQMDIPAIIIEKNARIGDNWRQRYPTLNLHTPKTAHELLYSSYPSTWPKFTPRDKLSDWFESYANTQDLVVWTNSTMLPRPTYDAERKRWNVIVDHAGVQVELHPAHIVLATGTLGAPRIPKLEDEAIFRGETLHSSRYQGGTRYAGKKVVVIGAGNSAMDICQDCVSNGAQEVTMVQRSATSVTSVHHFAAACDQVWPDGLPTDAADYKFAAMPMGLFAQQVRAQSDTAIAADAELHAKLRKAGFKFTMGRHGAGAVILIYDSLSGYMLDHGAADFIASGEIKLKQGVEPKRLTESSVVFSDGSELEADAVIFGTGFLNIREVNKQWFGAEIIDKTSEVYGLDEEGEQRGSYRPTGHPGLWYATGDFFMARFLSKQLALMIKGQELGLL